MGDWGSIILRYNINSEEEPIGYKGIICNHYRGLDPFGMVSRAANGLSYFLGSIKHYSSLFLPIDGPTKYEGSYYQTYRRMFDVDFKYCHLFVSCDAVTAAKQRLEEGKINKEDLNDEILWCDVDYGQLLIDVSGTPDALAVKYAYVRNICELKKSYTVEEYIEWNKEDKDKLKEAVEYINEVSAYMSLDERKEFVGTDLYEYAFFEECNKKCVDDISIEDISIEDLSIDDLELSVRSYNCLKRAGIDTVVQLKEMSDEDFQKAGIQGRSYEEIKKKLERLKSD